jgi:uncharacterized protein YjdB
VGQTQRLTATILPGNATNTNLAWASSNENIAIVANGAVTAVGAGYATITVKTEDGGKTATCIVTVPVSAESVALFPLTVTLLAGQTETITANVLPLNAANKDVTWTSSNTAAATVANGVVTALAQGNATIVATTVDGNKSAACLVTVNPVSYPNPVTHVSLTPAALTLLHGRTQAVTASISPDNASNKGVMWSSSNFAVASVTNGMIKAVYPGQATITVTTDDGGKTAACVVTVTPVPVTGMSLKPKAALWTGSISTLTPTFEPSDATNKNMLWTSSDAGVATVDDDGLIEAIASGMAIIKGRTQDGGFEAECELSVVNVYATGGGGEPWVFVNGRTQLLLGEQQGYYVGEATSIFATGSGDYYVAGSYGFDQYEQVARLWKNGEPYQDLVTTNNFYSELADSVFVLGDDVYVAGYSFLRTGMVIPKLWKNNQEQPLENIPPSCYANSVAVSGNDAYVAGLAYDTTALGYNTILWKNGAAAILNETVAFGGTGNSSLFISGDDVYVAGYRYEGDGAMRPAVWKNGVLQALELVEGAWDTYVNSIFVSGQDVHAAGYYFVEDYGYLFSYPLYWKNGVIQPIFEPVFEGQAEIYSIFVLDGVVFMAGSVHEPSDWFGWHYNNVAIWIDGVPHQYPYLSSDAKSIFVTK